MKLSKKTTDILVNALRNEMYRLRELIERVNETEIYKNRLKDVEEAHKELIIHRETNTI